MRRVIYLARHGETEWNRIGRMQGHSDIPLNETGRDQARQLGESLKGHGVRLVGSSDLSRARETAAIVAGVVGAEIWHPDPDLRERSFGALEGLLRDECAERHPDAWRRYGEDPKQTLPEAETFDSILSRVKAAIHRAARQMPDEDGLLLITHGAAMRALSHSLGGSPTERVMNVAAYRLVTDKGAPLEMKPLERR